MATTYKREEPIITPKDIFIGHPEARISLMQFGDYECEFALHDHFIVREVLRRYQGIVKFNYRHFPQLKIHQRAHKAAEAAIAAAQVGKFPEMHDLILHNRRNLGAASLAFYARELGIGGIQFIDVLVSGRFGQCVQDDLAAGLRMGIKKAPTFFINGEKLQGQISVRNICAKVDCLCKVAIGRS